MVFPSFPYCRSRKVAGSLPRQAVDESFLVYYVSRETPEDLMMMACPKNSRSDNLNIKNNDVVLQHTHIDKPSDAQSTLGHDWRLGGL